MWNFLERDSKSRRWEGNFQQTSQPSAPTPPLTSYGSWSNCWWFPYPRTHHHNKPKPIRWDLPGIIRQNAAISSPRLLLPSTHKQHQGSEKQHVFFAHVGMSIFLQPPQFTEVQLAAAESRVPHEHPAHQEMSHCLCLLWDLEEVQAKACERERSPIPLADFAAEN